MNAHTRKSIRYGRDYFHSPPQALITQCGHTFILKSHNFVRKRVFVSDLIFSNISEYEIYAVNVAYHPLKMLQARYEWVEYVRVVNMRLFCTFIPPTFSFIFFITKYA